MSTDTKEKIQQLEKLLLSEDLEELNNATANFNIFNALKLQNNEIRHSNFLAWLLSPFETHKLGDYCLREFLKSAVKEYSLDERVNISLNDIIFYNLNDTDIKREYKNIDLLIISRQNKFVCIIENKIWTGEHDCQLEKYAGIVNSEFKDYNKLYIYLSPKNECNSQLFERKCKGTNDNVYYIPMNYTQIHEIIEKTLKFKSKAINSDVKIFIEHYNNMLERDIMGETNEKIITLCRKIYRENKNAIDLINECNDFRAELSDILAMVLKERQDIDTTTIYQENNCTLCLPNGIKDIEKLRFSSFKPDNLIIHLHFVGNFKWRDCLYLEIIVTEASKNNFLASENKNKLLKLLESQLEVKFNGKEDWKYTKNVPILTKDEFYHCDNSDVVMTSLSKKLDDIKPKYIDKLQKILNDFKFEF